uniref:KTSC domain-containing protein n=1 Tax=uncultured Sphingomonas sp. TaxID=158754 RepID=UPI0025E249C9|nr:KTSC domain-containing protein [uncultured Sphingomonas sp.]
MLVDSEAMREVVYDRRRRTLRIRFADGGWWQYFDVPQPVHNGLIEAESHGRYFHEHIRGRYRYERFDTPRSQV